MAHEAHSIPSSPGKVKLTLNVSLTREQAERLTAKAIREGKNLEVLVAENLEATLVSVLNGAGCVLSAFFSSCSASSHPRRALEREAGRGKELYDRQPRHGSTGERVGSVGVIIVAQEASAHWRWPKCRSLWRPRKTKTHLRHL